MQFAVVDVCVVKKVVVPQAVTVHLQPKTGIRLADARLELFGQFGQLLLGLADFALHANSSGIHPGLFVRPIKTGRQRASNLEAVTALGRRDLHRREKCLHAVEVIDRDGVIFVVVALGTAYREAKENRTDRRGHFAEQLVPGLVTARLGKRRQPKKRQRNCALGIHARQLAGTHDFIELIAGNLLPDEEVVRLVAVERVDDIVAVTPRVRHVGVALITGGVGVAREIEPVAPPAFAVVRIVKQPIDQAPVSQRVAIVDEGIGDIRRRRDTEQIKIQPADECPALGQRRRLDALGLEFGEDESVNRVADPVGLRDHRRRHLDKRRKRPMPALLRIRARFLRLAKRGSEQDNESDHSHRLKLPSGKNAAENIPPNAGQFTIKAGVKVGQLLMVEAHLVKNGRMHITHMDRFTHPAQAELIGLADGGSAFHVSPRHPHGQRPGIVLATGTPRHATILERRSSHLRCPNHKRLIEKPPLLEIRQQT